MTRRLLPEALLLGAVASTRRAQRICHSGVGGPSSWRMAAALNAGNALSVASTAMWVGSLVHRVCRLDYLWHRAAAHAEAHLAYAAALFNTLLGLAGPAGDLAIARYSL